MALSGFTTSEANAILNFLYRGSSYSPPASHWLALLLTAASYSTTGAEVSTSGTGYARFELPVASGTWSAPDSNRQIKNAIEIAFPVALADWGTIPYVGIRTAITAGTMTRFGKLSEPRTILLGGQLILPINSVIIRLD